MTEPTPDLIKRREQINRGIALRCAVEASKNYTMTHDRTIELAEKFKVWIERGIWNAQR